MNGKKSLDPTHMKKLRLTIVAIRVDVIGKIDPRKSLSSSSSSRLCNLKVCLLGRPLGVILLLIQVLGIVHLLVKLPEIGAPHPKALPDCGLVPKHTISDLIRLYGIVEDETLIVFCTRIHHL